MLGERRPSGWVLAKVREGRGPVRGVLRTPDCEEAPQGAPLLDVEHAFNVAESPATRLCALCGCVQELTPMLAGLTTSPTADLPWWFMVGAAGAVVGPVVRACRRSSKRLRRGPGR
ncbi:DUF6233 domain-containing protein [Streptomyces sp. NPDC058424]|uniref:DUF6233 domain-containing protein n=1 Tax=Streptomyces sp. NPDC058424 TaxID=3346491 RepID=UPI0036637D41